MTAMRILIIEDDAEAGEYLVKGLRESGHGAEVVQDGRDRLLQAATGEWDVLIVDRMMPGLDGLSLVEHLRATATDAGPVPLGTRRGRRPGPGPERRR